MAQDPTWMELIEAGDKILEVAGWRRPQLGGHRPWDPRHSVTEDRLLEAFDDYMEDNHPEWRLPFSEAVQNYVLATCGFKRRCRQRLEVYYDKAAGMVSFPGGGNEPLFERHPRYTENDILRERGIDQEGRARS